jgi:uncharacterized membrane protein YecN with MAPEG domain
MALSVVPCYAAALALFFVLLSLNVIRGRGKHRVTLGSGGVGELERRIRVHANFAEYVPFSLLLLAMAELRGLPKPALQVLCGYLVVGRLLHAWGVSRPREDPRIRVSGMILTFIAMSGASIGLLLSKGAHP